MDALPIWTTDATSISAGLLLARLVFGLYMAAHGAQKLFGWFGGPGLAGTGGFFEQLGFRPGRLFAGVAGATELTGGLLVALGLFGPVGPALIVSVMIVAIGSVHWRHGAFTVNNGVELPLLFATAGVGLALGGPGAFSLDALVGLTQFWNAGLAWVALALAAFGGFGNLLVRRPPPQASLQH